MTLLPPTPAQQKRIDKELPSDPEMRKQDIRALREWLSKQPHLPNHIDDGKLKIFLFNCKNNIERCKLILERYYTIRTSLPEFFVVRDPQSQDIRDSFNTANYFTLPSLTEEGYRVSIFRLRDTDVEKFSFQAIVRRVLMIFDIRLMEESCLSNIMIIDLEGFSVSHFAKFTPTQSIVRRAMLAVQDSMPFRLFCVYFLHASSSITNILNIFYPLLKEKLTQKFRVFNGGAEELHAYMNKDILPNEWGGKAGTFQELNALVLCIIKRLAARVSLQMDSSQQILTPSDLFEWASSAFKNADFAFVNSNVYNDVKKFLISPSDHAAWQEKIEKNRDWFLQDEKLSRINEKARLQESKPSCLVMEFEGIQGSFRQLNID